MRLPPHTPKQFIEELAKQTNLRRRIARGWMIIGSLGVVFIAAIAVAHYAYGVPVYDDNNRQLSTPANTLMMLLFIGGGAASFVVMGILLYRWNPD